jgi:hypothetical protein
MDEVFVIMQIGDAQLDAMCDEAIDPAIREADAWIATTRATC